MQKEVRNAVKKHHFEYIHQFKDKLRVLNNDYHELEKEHLRVITTVDE